jgi:hypothetical protein
MRFSLSLRVKGLPLQVLTVAVAAWAFSGWTTEIDKATAVAKIAAATTTAQ